MRRVLLGRISMSILAIALNACSGGSGGGASSATVSFSGRISTSSLMAIGDTLTNQVVECKSVDPSASKMTGAVSADGSFTVNVPKDEAFFCKVMDSSITASYDESNGATVSSQTCGIRIEDSSKQDFQGNDSSQGLLGLKNDLSLSSSLTCNPTEGFAKIPSSSIELVKSTSIELPSVIDLHGKNFSVTCVSSGDTEIDQMCRDKALRVNDPVNDSSTKAYFRVATGTQSSESIKAIAIWADQVDAYNKFSLCGSKDLGGQFNSSLSPAVIWDGGVAVGTAGTPASASENWKKWDSGLTGSGASTTGSGCGRANMAGTTDAEGWPHKLLVFGKVEESVAGWTVKRTESLTNTSTHCASTVSYTFNLSKSAVAGYSYLGTYEVTTTKSDSGGTCSDPTPETLTFSLGFTEI